MHFFTLILLSIELLLGFYINIRKIKRVLKEKHITWELEIYHSVVCMIYILSCLVTDVLEYACHTLSGMAGLLFFYSAIRCIKMFCYNIILCHSLTVATYKYYVILHNRRLPNDDNNMEKEWLILIIILPILWILGSFTRNIELSKNVLFPESMCGIKVVDPQKILKCYFNDSDYYKSKWTALYVVTNAYCIIQLIVIWTLNLNLFEVVLYVGIFRFMNR